MRASDLPQVRALPLFESMSSRGFEELMRPAYLQTFPAQLELIAAGDPADFLYVVIDGVVELYASRTQRETTLEMVEPVGTFILAAVLRDAVYLMSARTWTKSRILMIPAQAVRETFAEDDGFARAIVHELAGCYRGVVKRQKDIKLRTSVERLANLLLRLHPMDHGQEPFELPYDKRTIASLLGMTPENLSRAFNTLKPYGVLVEGPQVRLTDRAALRVLARPDPLIDDFGV